MQVETRKGRFWWQLATPILWPVLVAQALLAGLCLVAGLLYWWLTPSTMPWDIFAWLLLALLIGLGLSTAIFLMLLRQRLVNFEQRLGASLEQLEDCLARHADLPVAPRDNVFAPAERVSEVTESIERLITAWQADLNRGRQSEYHLADEAQALRSRIERLEADRERLRDSLRMRSHYLGHLQQSLTPLMASLQAALREEGGNRERLEEFSRRLTDTLTLLGSAEGGALLLDDSVSPWGRILIVDDGPVNLMLAQQVLEQHGLEVVTATSGAEALSCLDEMPFDLIFMDIFMADMDGVDTCRAWRERETHMPDRQRSVVVALTANTDEADRRRFSEAGMDDYLGKPYRPQDLLETVRYWLPGALEAGEG